MISSDAPVPIGFVNDKRKKMLIEARGISKQFGGVEVLSDINLDFCVGEPCTSWGNGAGKSTLLKYLRVFIDPPWSNKTER